MHLNVTPAKSTKVLKLMDKDGDGKVDRSEWRDMVLAMNGAAISDAVANFPIGKSPEFIEKLPQMT